MPRTVNPPALEPKPRAEILAHIETPFESARAKISSIVGAHLPTLARRRMALIRIDAYGVVDSEGWTKECQYFVDKVILPKLSMIEAQAILDAGLTKTMNEMLEGAAREECARIETNFLYSENMLPVEYERFCAFRLEICGWTCELTKGSGDQGADVIARKGGILLVIQCKKYSSPVGNGAVQEVVAAKGHLRANFAAVVSNAPFTRSAIELATSTRTLLLNHSELDIIDLRLRTI
jgi:restriction system protein